ncbi:MAG: hypothetical protein ACYCWW_13385 [Deltaproteobacteria bacterium]
MMALRVALIGALLCLPGCGPSRSLSGSFGAIVPLGFNRTAVYASASSLQLDYYSLSAGSETLVVQLAVDTTGSGLAPGKTISLAGTVAPGQPRTSVVSVAASGSTFVLPAISKGSLTLSGGGVPGKETYGSFELAFEDGVGLLGQGTTLTGSFDDVAQGGDVPPAADGGPPPDLPDAGSDAGDGG